jgi:hypothetical protein
MIWRPRGIFDDPTAEKVVAFIEHAEQAAATPFNRYTDFNGLTELRLKIGHTFSIADRRSHISIPVKSAFFADRTVSFGFARMIETLMEGAPIHVRAFRDRTAAADWLEVPLEVLMTEV